MRDAVEAWAVRGGLVLAMRILALATLVGGLIVALSACSSGPQLPVVTTPISISCTWTVHAGEGEGSAEDVQGSRQRRGTLVVSDNDCSIDRSSAAPTTETTGNRSRDTQVSPQTSVSVPVAGGASP